MEKVFHENEIEGPPKPDDQPRVGNTAMFEVAMAVRSRFLSVLSNALALYPMTDEWINLCASRSNGDPPSLLSSRGNFVPPLLRHTLLGVLPAAAVPDPAASLIKGLVPV